MLEGLAISETTPSTSGLSHDGVERQFAFGITNIRAAWESGLA